MEIGEFHWTKGLYFKREPDGAVRIRIDPGTTDAAFAPATTDAVYIPAAEWASIVASVAQGGEPENYAKAVALHG